MVNLLPAIGTGHHPHHGMPNVGFQTGLAKDVILFAHHLRRVLENIYRSRRTPIVGPAAREVENDYNSKTLLPRHISQLYDSAPSLSKKRSLEYPISNELQCEAAGFSGSDRMGGARRIGCQAKPEPFAGVRRRDSEA